MIDANRRNGSKLASGKGMLNGLSCTRVSTPAMRCTMPVRDVATSDMCKVGSEQAEQLAAPQPHQDSQPGRIDLTPAKELSNQGRIFGGGRTGTPLQRSDPGWGALSNSS